MLLIKANEVADYLKDYPNPSTNISYEISKTQDVKLFVYDIIGRKVSELVNKTQTSGFYTVNFDVSHLASGYTFISCKRKIYRLVKEWC
ncbi:hypothetical protein A8B79_05545 [Balneola sp. EhC07]|uniref:T9SS type A sorting domain-containing protein n=1 Tax=Balneola sp. EhC07 TaxID=1849360 RepID=UPI0007F3AFCE|nr:hypothetical protein A8B79_05545 [Balneola sp. EhC07]